MQNKLYYRLKKVEKEVEKMLNPFNDEGRIILVFLDKGETNEGKIAEEEKKLGRKINSNKVIFVRIHGMDSL